MPENDSAKGRLMTENLLFLTEKGCKKGEKSDIIEDGEGLNKKAYSTVVFGRTPQGADGDSYED